MTTVSISAGALEYQKLEATYDVHRISAEQVTGIEITLSTEVTIEGECNSAFLHGDFKEVLLPAGSSSLYKTYVADFGAAATERLCLGVKKEVVSITKTFEADEQGRVD